MKAGERLPFEELFFDGCFDVPLTKEKAGISASPIEMVRLVLSAVNRQPWRIIVREGVAHFYLKRSKGFSASTVDMQKIDMGIALCHFALAAKEADFNVIFTVSDPEIEADLGAECIASYLIK